MEHFGGHNLHGLVGCHPLLTLLDFLCHFRLFEDEVQVDLAFGETEEYHPRHARSNFLLSFRGGQHIGC